MRASAGVRARGARDARDPGPGWLFIFLRAGHLSTELEWAHRLDVA
ncbi:PGPGW domain-containing protein [Kocuria rhizophila]|nr:PGPGW domain-containing protein [Kocuria rhizophila]